MENNNKYKLYLTLAIATLIALGFIIIRKIFFS